MTYEKEIEQHIESICNLMIKTKYISDCNFLQKYALDCIAYLKTNHLLNDFEFKKIENKIYIAKIDRIYK